jgi:hypothetical protein
MKRKAAGKHTPALAAGAPSARHALAARSEKDTGGKSGWRHAASLDRQFARGKSFAEKDMTDLPPELLRELSIGQVDPLDAQIVEVLSSSGGSANLDQILIGLFRKFQVIQKRRFLQNKVWRMIRKGRLYKAPGTRGVFCLAPQKNRRRNNRKK